eukprot:scaffold47809_cov59-Attheya_sp.AAC.2
MALVRDARNAPEPISVGLLAAAAERRHHVTILGGIGPLIKGILCIDRDCVETIGRGCNLGQKGNL